MKIFSTILKLLESAPVNSWKNKSFTAPLTFEEKRKLILRINSPRVKISGGVFQQNLEDLSLNMMLDRYQLGLFMSVQKKGESFNFGAGQAQATESLINQTKTSTPELRQMVIEKYYVDLDLLMRGDTEGADLLKNTPNKIGEV